VFNRIDNCDVTDRLVSTVIGWQSAAFGRHSATKSWSLVRSEIRSSPSHLEATSDKAPTFSDPKRRLARIFTETERTS